MRYSLRALFLLAAGVAFIWAIWPFRPRPDYYETSCRNNLTVIGEALSRYEVNNGTLPPAYFVDGRGKKLYSWRAALLSNLGRSDLQRAFDPSAAWDAPQNTPVANTPIDVLRCRSEAWRRDMPLTNYLAVVGPNTAWPGSMGRKLSEIKDIHSAILIIEWPDAVPWAAPQDLDYDQLIQKLQNAPAGHTLPDCHPAGGIHALFADGHVETIPADISIDKFKQMLSIDGQPTAK